MSKNKLIALITSAFMLTSTTSVVWANPIEKNVDFDKTIENFYTKNPKALEKYTTIEAVKDKKVGDKVEVRAVVTGKIGNNMFIQDNTSGIYVYMAYEKSNNIHSGNVISFTGTIDEYKGVKQLKDIKGLNIESQKSKLPDAINVTPEKLNDDKLVGKLVSVKNLTIKSISNGKKGYDIIATDGNYNVSLRVDKWLNPYIDKKNFKIGSLVNVVSPLGRYTDYKGNITYQLILRSIDDITVLENSEGSIPKGKVLKICEIQGKVHRSQYENQNVSDVEGIVTTVSSKDKYQKGFYMQCEKDDGDAATSEGIFVETRKLSEVKPGDKVKVSGVVKERINDFKGGTGLTETEIKSDDIKIVSSNNKLPDSVEINMKGTLLKNIDNDELKKFEPEEDAIDYYESLEGMRVELKDPLIVGADERYGEICILTHNGENSKEDLTPNNGIKAKEGDFNPEIITIDDVIIPISGKNGFLDKKMKIKVGDKLDGNVSGVMSYGFGKFKVLNTEKLPKIISGKTQRDITSIKESKNKVTVASYNIENFNREDTDKVNGIAKDIAENLKSPDIVGLVEVQDDSGDKDDGTTKANKNYEALISSLKTITGLEYKYTEIAPNNNEDGGKPGGNIRQGFIYRSDRVKLPNKKSGDATSSVEVNSNGLSVNPGRIDPKNPAFAHSRKPLACEFEFNGENLVVIANHLGSKRGDQSLFGSVQPPKMKSEIKRVEQAKVINKFIKKLKSANSKTNVVVLGDLNDFEFSKTIKTIEGNEVTDMINTLPVNERFSYVHNGNSQVLDHILVSNHLKEKTKVDIVNINSQFTEGYGRLSDHDPVLVQIDVAAR